MASVKNYIHYHNNMNALNKITEENLKRMIRECVEEIIGEYVEIAVNNIVNEKLEGLVKKEELEKLVNLEGLATIDYVNECLGEKKLIYLAETEYEALSEEEKNKDGIVYNIIQG